MNTYIHTYIDIHIPAEGFALHEDDSVWDLHTPKHTLPLSPPLLSRLVLLVVRVVGRRGLTVDMLVEVGVDQPHHTRHRGTVVTLLSHCCCTVVTLQLPLQVPLVEGGRSNPPPAPTW
jgi:hypothetical protein